MYDPFSGRGTTVLEAGLMGRQVLANDVNPLSEILTRPRFFIPSVSGVVERLESIPRNSHLMPEMDLSMFYHDDTLQELLSLRRYLLQRRQEGQEDEVDRWIRMIATNRLTGHSTGFFSVYTLPPNQAVSCKRQIIINEKRGQIPPYRDTHALIIKKTKQMLKDLLPREIWDLKEIGRKAMFLQKPAHTTPDIPSDSVHVTVTSPPFLNVVQYSQDNWLRCWFNGLDAQAIEKSITIESSVWKWSQAMGEVFQELFRITTPGGWVAFEVGEVKGGKVNLEEEVVPLGLKAGFSCQGIMINQQDFTKTANIWGVHNNRKGTNSNRIVLFQKEVLG